MSAFVASFGAASPADFRGAASQLIGPSPSAVRGIRGISGFSRHGWASNADASSCVKLALALTVHLEIAPEHIDGFKKVMLRHADCSRNEYGCLRFDVLQEADAPNKFTLYEFPQEFSISRVSRDLSESADACVAEWAGAWANTCIISVDRLSHYLLRPAASLADEEQGPHRQVQDMLRATRELWAGTPYAKWIERDLRIKIQREKELEIQQIHMGIRQEELRRLEVEQELASVKESSAKDLQQFKDLADKGKAKTMSWLLGHAGAGICSGPVQLMAECFSAWQVDVCRLHLSRSKGKRPDMRGFKKELQQISEASITYITDMQNEIAAMSHRYMDVDSYQDGKPSQPASRSSTKENASYKGPHGSMFLGTSEDDERTQELLGSVQNTLLRLQEEQENDPDSADLINET
ncbi:unnamed protein product [Polarella glacialis]|uniref:ABM domain-containing protein n=1 Tax=Polarella glacialis TaxID=89957 RepID=A0A813H5X5_POLGL|nr:unnamed protein product [Polarella glacialis]